MNKEEFENLVKKLEASNPGGVLRTGVEDALGGKVSAKTLANADASNRGPSRRYLCRGRVVYPVRELLMWAFTVEENVHAE